jgi:2-polyprenyl-6-methoxyphenol hydroxylase-like FAD-dependent oxidoreductase
MKNLLGKHAIVVGAGIGGLAAAKALSTYFEKVTVLERDALSDGPEARIGTPQARQVLFCSKAASTRSSNSFPGWKRSSKVRARSVPGPVLKS